MSQHNRSLQPVFNYTIQGPSYPFDNQVPSLQINTVQPWMAPRPRSVQDQMPSPSTSVRTVMTAPDPRLFNRSSFHQANRSPIDANIDPNLPNNNLSLLAPPGNGSASSYNPIVRHLQDQPWSAGNLRSSSTGSGRNSLNQPNIQYGQYRGSPGSDIESNLMRSDSGYQSHHPQSIFSNEPSQTCQDLPSSITRQASNVNDETIQSDAPRIAQMPSDQISQRSSASVRSGKSYKCAECDDTLKCKSDLKKHLLKHNKPFKCTFPNCKRAGQGFTTVNDLDRHKKSVHQIGLKTKSYQCASETCRNKEKIWPRLDNFKQHIERMHKDEDELDLITRSTFRPRESVPVVDDRSVAPMDTTLAVAGMGRSFSGNPAMDTVSTMELPTDHDTRRWLNQNSDDFTQDTFGIPNHLSGAIRRPNITRFRESQGAQEQSYTNKSSSGKASRRESQTPATNATTLVDSEQPTSEKQRPKSRPSLSTAPQTKAEQQRSALKKFSQAIAGEFRSTSSSEPVDLEDLVLRILHQATDSPKWDETSSHQKANTKEYQDANTAVTLTKSEALHASQMISNLIKQSPGSAYTVRRRSTQGVISNAKICPKCGYAVARVCDLRKHMKRHEKPYGCTYPKCHKRFGAKSDWKRHENSQHFQLEAFRCAQPSRDAFEAACGKHFFRATLFAEHLKTEHKIPSQEQHEKEAKSCRIGKNCQGQFWCGFCNKVIELKERRNAAWDERFDHIAHHFEKERKSIDEWVCVEQNQTKKELLKEMDRYVYDDDEEREADRAGDVDADVLTPPPPVATEQWPVASNPGPPPPPEGYSPINPKKRQAAAEPTASNRRLRQRRTTSTHRYCCSCNNGPCSSLEVACMECGHPLCGNCNTVEEWIDEMNVDYQ